MRTIETATLQKLEAFVKAGGVLISTGLLPSRSTDRGGDSEVNDIIGRLFPALTGGSCSEAPFMRRQHENNGRAYLLGRGDKGSLSGALADSEVSFDVSIPDITAPGGNFTYIHKALDSRDVYFFANSGDSNSSAMPHYIEFPIKNRPDFEALLQTRLDPLSTGRYPEN